MAFLLKAPKNVWFDVLSTSVPSVTLHGWQVSLWVPYWVVNATSLPLTLQMSGIIHGTSDEVDSTTPLEWQLPVVLGSNIDASGSLRSTNEDVGREGVSSRVGVDSKGRKDRHRRLETHGLGDERPRQPPSSVSDDLERLVRTRNKMFDWQRCCGRSIPYGVMVSPERI